MAKEHRHTRVVNLAAERVQRMLDGVEGSPSFMQKYSDRTERKHHMIQEVPQSVRDALNPEAIREIKRMELGQ